MRNLGRVFRGQLFGTIVGIGVMSHCSVHAAPPGLEGIPNAGSVEHTIDTDHEVDTSTQDVNLNINIPLPDTLRSDMEITIKGVNFTGDLLDLEPGLIKIAQNFLAGRNKITFTQLSELQHLAQSYLHEQGYMTAVVYLPEQDITAGTVEFHVLIGIYGDVNYDNNSSLRTKRAAALAHRIKKGNAIEKKSMDRTLLTLNDIPGVKAHAFLTPSSEEGKALSTFRLTTTEDYSAYSFIDNYGSRYTGRNRLGLRYMYNNLSNNGDQISFAIMRTNKNLDNYDVKYELPVGNDGTTVGISYASLLYELGDRYADINAYGSAHTVQLFSRSILKRSLFNNSYLRVSLEHRSLKDSLGRYSYFSDKESKVLRIGFEGDDRKGNRYASYRLTHSIGELSPQSLEAHESARESATDGTFNKTELSLYWLQRLNSKLTWETTLAAQYAWSNLDSSEQLYLSGHNGVRAFSPGEAGGDTGSLISIELRYQLPEPKLQTAIFYDGGIIRKSHSISDSRSLQGIGVGFIYNAKRSYARIDYAVPLGSRYSHSEASKENGRWWLRWVQKL